MYKKIAVRFALKDSNRIAFVSGPKLSMNLNGWENTRIVLWNIRFFKNLIIIF